MGAALAEMRRVLKKPHGRAFILDTDWGTSILASSDPERCKRVRDAITATFGFSDVRLPSKIPGLARSVGLRVSSVQGFTLAKSGSFERGSYFDVVSSASK